MGEKVGESGSRMHLKDQFRQIEPGKARIDCRARVGNVKNNDPSLIEPIAAA